MSTGAAPEARTRAVDRVDAVRVLHLVSSLEMGGMEHFVLRIAAAQRSAGHDAGILAVRGGPLAAEADRLQVPVSVVGGSRLPERVLRAGLLLARSRPHVLHAHNPTSLQYAVLGRVLGGGRVVMTYHGRGRSDGRVPGAAEWARTDAVVAVSQGAAEQLGRPEGLRGEVRIIRNGVARPEPRRSRDEVRQALGLGDRLTGIIVARVDRLKGHDTLLRALALLRNEGQELTLLIAGDGHFRTEADMLGRELGLGEPEVRWLGARSDVPDLLGAADFFVLPSLSEGLPLSVLEAMAQGLPVVATHVGGLPELVRSEREGLLVPPADPEALAGALRRVAGSAELRAALGAAAEARVRAEFAFDGMVQEYLELYRSLLGRR